MNIVNVIFRFFDFFIIVGLSVYGCTHYLIPTIKKMLKEYAMFLYNLESDCKNLQLTTQSIYENIQDQDRQFEKLQAKFQLWQKKREEQIAVQIEEQRAIDQVMQQRFEVQSVVIKNDYILQEQLPMILDATTQKLHRKYHEAGASSQYLDSLIDLMKERS